MRQQPPSSQMCLTHQQPRYSHWSRMLQFQNSPRRRMTRWCQSSPIFHLFRYNLTRRTCLLTLPHRCSQRHRTILLYRCTQRHQMILPNQLPQLFRYNQMHPMLRCTR